jgi:Fe(3+) dicitrate transport protein
MFYRPNLILITALIVLTSIVSAGAHTPSASISGRILDPTGSVVSGAAVKLSQRLTGFESTVRTDATGNFTFDTLGRGDYKISVRAEGYSSVVEEVALSEAETRSIEIIVQPYAAWSTYVWAAQASLDSIPGSVYIVDKKSLSNSRPFTFSEVLRKVPGITIRDEEGFGLRPNIGVRGLNPTRSSKVLLLEDGVPLAFAPYGDNASYYHPPVDRFDSIEVLKGSGQILYGPMTVGGVINYITPDPPAKPQGSLTLVGGNRDYFNGRIDYGGTWKGVGLLFDYLRKQGEGARENVRSGLNDFNFKSVAGIGSKHLLMLKANYYGEHSNVTYSGLREDEYKENPRQNPFRNDFFEGDRFGASASHLLFLDSNFTLTTNLYGSVFKRDWWRQSSNSAQRPNDSADPACGGMANLYSTCGNEGRLRQYYTGGIEPRFHASHRLFGLRNETDFGVRAHFESQRRLQKNGAEPTSRDGVTVENNERKNEAYSSFIQNRFLLGDLTITPGVRIEHVDYRRTNLLANGGKGVTGEADLTQLIPGISLSHRTNQHLLIFGGIHRGFAPPRTEDIINNTTGGTLDLDPELSWNSEVGIRSVLRKGLMLDLTFFRMDYENQIVAASLAGGVGSTLTNAGQTLHQGTEMALEVDTGAFLKSRHSVYFRAVHTYLPTAKSTGGRFSSVSGFGTVRVSGNRLPYAAEHTMDFIVGYSHPSGTNALIEAVHSGSQFGDDLNTVKPTPDGQRGLIPGYTVWNATLNYKVESMRTTVFVTAKNLFDKTFIVDRSRGILPSSPRLVQAGLTFNF